MKSSLMNRKRALRKSVLRVRVTKKAPIAALDISTRAFNILFLNGIRTVGDLANKTEIDLIKLKGMGRITLWEIKSTLNFHGYKLR